MTGTTLLHLCTMSYKNQTPSLDEYKELKMYPEIMTQLYYTYVGDVSTKYIN